MCRPRNLQTTNKKLKKELTTNLTYFTPSWAIHFGLKMLLIRMVNLPSKINTDCLQIDALFWLTQFPIILLSITSNATKLKLKFKFSDFCLFFFQIDHNIRFVLFLANSFIISNLKLTSFAASSSLCFILFHLIF